MAKTKQKQKEPEKAALPPDVVLAVSDFESLKIKFDISNTTTNTKFRDVETIRLIELLEQGMIIEAPGRSCSNGHSLMLTITVNIPLKKPLKFTSTAKADAIEHLEDTGEDRITLSFVQFDEKGFDDFCALFSSRQSEIELFLAAARGY